MAYNQANSGTSRSDLAPVASTFFSESQRGRLFAAMRAFGYYYLGDRTSGVADVEGSGVLRVPETSDMQFTRLNGSKPPEAKPESYAQVTFKCADRGQAINADEDDDAFARYFLPDGGGESAFDRYLVQKGTAKLGEAMARLAHATLGGSSAPGNPADTAAGAAWSATTTTIVTDFDGALTALGHEAGAVYLDWTKWRDFKGATELWEDFGGNTGFGRLNDEQARVAMSTLSGCDPENVYITDANLGLGSYCILYDRPLGPTPDASMDPVGCIYGVSNLKATAPPGVMESPGSDPALPQIGGIRISEIALSHTIKQMYTRMKADFQVAADAVARISGI